MAERPESIELVEAVREFLENDVMTAPDQRMAFQARIAANVLRIVEREMREGPRNERAELDRLAELLGHDGALEDLRTELAAAIRSGEFSGTHAELLVALKATAKASLEVANPKYLS